MPDLLKINPQGLAMPLASSDMQYRYSGGAANSSPNASLGGTKSSVQVAAGANGIFDDITAVQSAAGLVEYRCVYVHNAHATLPLGSAVLWLTSNTPSGTTDVALGLGSSAANGTETAVTDETTAPVGVVFNAAASKAGGIVLGDILPGQSRAVWVRRTVSAGSAALASDPFTLRLEGETS